MSVNQISVFLENTPGQLLEFTKLLEANRIDLRALSVAEAEDFGILRVIVDNSLKTLSLLKEEGYVCSVTPVLAVEIPDQPGALVSILNALGEAGVNLEYMYAFLGRKKESAYMIFRVSDNEYAIKVLRTAGISTIEEEDLHKLFA